MNIIADIAGRFDELMLLLAKMPQGEEIILVGDLMDRGTQSKQVIEWAMKTPNVIAIYGNHEDMMVNSHMQHITKNRFSSEYSWDDWTNNGGHATLDSYGIDNPKDLPADHIEWLKKNPRFIQRDGLYISHAPWPFGLGKRADETDAIWNRYPPQRVPGIFQIFGHNSSMKAYGDYAICIDNCSKKVLQGIHWPSKMIYEQEYLNKIPSNVIRERGSK